MEDYNFEKLAREIVANRLGSLGERAPSAAAEIVKKILIAALQSTAKRQEPRDTVTAVCRGALGGLMLINQDLPRSAALLLKTLPSVSQESHIPTQDLMTWAMRGLAEVGLLAGPESVQEMEAAIESEFMGAGGVFSGICAEARG